ncbi:MAG: MmgE/PrpD family protein [Campylobacter sp.]|nr:MmgE/PrpD family protein [Campylobacter sp.]
MTSITHLSVVIAPICFAVAQYLKLSGKDIILAYAISTQVMDKIALATMPMISQKGWHTTSAFMGYLLVW